MIVGLVGDARSERRRRSSGEKFTNGDSVQKWSDDRCDVGAGGTNLAGPGRAQHQHAEFAHREVDGRMCTIDLTTPSNVVFGILGTEYYYRSRCPTKGQEWPFATTRCSTEITPSPNTLLYIAILSLGMN